MGGYVYRGSRYPSLTRYYFFGDYASGKIGFIDPSGNFTAQSGLIYSSLISFGEDRAGELYLVSFSNGTISRLTVPDEPLPVRLIYFRLNADESPAILEWRTAVESNFAYFEIEQSYDGKNFRLVQQIRPLGSGQNYSFREPTSRSNVCYYRLKMLDLDGSFSYSRIIVASNVKNIYPDVFPNPTSSFFQISGVQNGDVAKLYDTSGRLLKEFHVDSDVPWHIDMAPYANGLYILALHNRISELEKKIKIVKE